MFHTLKKRFKRWGRKISLTKRQQFVVVTVLLTIGLICTQVIPPEWRYVSVVIVSIITYILTAFVIREDLSGIEWATLMVLPVAFTAAVSLFYFLLPVRWLTRLPVAGLYSVGIYALILTANIYNVAAGRSIALLRAAHSVGFLLTLVTYFLLISTILAFRLPVFFNALLIGILSFVLSFQNLWTVNLEASVNPKVLHIALAIAFFLAQIGWVLAFWPVKSTLITLFLTTCFYSTVGMGQQFLAERLYKKTVIEFASVAFLVLGILLITTRWRGNF